MTFSDIINHLQSNGVSIKSRYITDTIDYFGFKIVTSQMDSFQPGYLYVGEYASIRSSTLSHGCGFLFPYQQDTNILLPPDSEYTIISSDNLDMNLLKIISDCFYFDSHLSEKLSYAEMFICEMAKGRDLKYLIDTASDIIQKPIILSAFNAEWAICSGSAYFHASNYPDIQYLLENNTIPPLYYEAHIQFHTIDRCRENDVFLLDNGIFREAPRLVAGIEIDNQVIAMIVALKTKQPFAQVDYSVMQILKTTITREIRQDKGVLTSFYENQLQHLLTGSAPLTKEQNSKINLALGATPSSVFQLCVLKYNREEKVRIETILRKNSFSGCKTAITSIDSLIIMLVSHFRTHADSQLFLSELKDCLAGYTTVCLVSEYIYSLTDISSEYQLLSNALPIASYIYPDEKIILYSNIYAYHMLYNLAPHEDISLYLSTKYKVLKKYDSEYNTNYCETLFLYLTSGSRKKVADIMHIHKNTVAYRLSKINEIIDGDIEDGETRFALQQSFYIDRYINSTK